MAIGRRLIVRTPDGEMRPSCRLPWTAGDRWLEILAAVGAAGHVILLILGPSRFPERVPMHFDALGRPDRWGGRGELLIVPAVGLALYVMLTVLSRFPRSFNYPYEITAENAARQYWLARRLILVLKTIIAWIFLVLVAGSVATARGVTGGLTPWFLLVFLGSTFGALAWWLRAASRAR